MNTKPSLLLLTFFSLAYALYGQERDTMVAAGPEYSRSKISTVIWGEHYREVWTTPVKAPILNPEVPGGGLTPKELGGGRQTKSLQFEGNDKNEYVARSINKTPDKAVPERLRGTFAAKVVKDQVSSAHPYGSLVVPKLAEAAGVYHTSPKLYYVPKNPGLGEFSKDFNDMLVTLEIRPDEDAISLSHYNDVDKTEKLFENLTESSMKKVDPFAFLNARLFDMYLGDWDRHGGQYKWGELLDEDGGRSYYPLPKDRDQVFTLFDGLLPSIASRRWAVRELEHFDHKFNDIAGLNYPARNIDRRFLSGLSRENWRQVAERLQQALTNEVIRQAVLDLPPEIYPINGKTIEEKLISRRDQITAIAMEYYDILAKKVNVTGSDENESFYITRHENGDVLVRGYNTSKGNRYLIFNRSFIEEETKEIRIYSMGGNDSLVVEGDARESILVRLLPGTGNDAVVDKSSVKGLFNHTKVYTHKNSGLDLTRSKETRLIRVNSDTTFAYSDSMAQYSYIGPALSLEYNVDDGLFLGGGIVLRKAGFMKEPWSSEHKLVANYSTFSQSYNAKYEGIFYSKIAKFWDLGLNAERFGPKYFLNYFGQGNESSEIYNIGYYRLRMTSFNFSPSAIHRVSKKFRYSMGPFAEYFRVESTPGRLTSELDFEAGQVVNTPYWFTGGFIETNLNTTDDELNPSRGVRWINTARLTSEINGPDLFSTIGSEFSFYYKLGNSPFILAHRIGGNHNLGDFKFFQSNFLGGTTNMRGYRRERFAGRTSAFLNNDLRIRVSNFNLYFVTGEWGLMGFADAGRVWADGENSNVIHYSYGPGAWVNMLNLFLVSGTYGLNEQGDRVFILNAGFLF